MRVFYVSKRKQHTHIKHLDRDVIAFWTFDLKNRLKFYSREKNRFFRECFPEQDHIYANINNVVFPYAAFLTRSTDNHVYEMTPDKNLSIAYTWDFGNLNIDKTTKKELDDYSRTNIRQKRDYIERIYASEVINYIFLTWGGAVRIICIRKSSGKTR